MSIAQIKNLQRRLANLESEAVDELNRACGHELWQSIGFDAFDGVNTPDAEPSEAGSQGKTPDDLPAE